MKSLLKKFIPKSALALYHKTLAHTAALWYRHPSNHLVVIGVTGTKGKSTTVFMIAYLFEQMGFWVGQMSTMQFQVGAKKWLNDTKMTMLGRFRLQRMLREMVNAGCQVAVIETSSEGIAQFRHLGINYDTLVFTNLYPEHIESHGSFEAYRGAKLSLFTRLSSLPKKSWSDIYGDHKKSGMIPKRIVVNLDDEYARLFQDAKADEHYGYTFTPTKNDDRIVAVEVKSSGEQITFKARGEKFTLPVMGEVNAWNAAAAITVGHAFGFTFTDMARALATLPPLPGRFELIQEGQPFHVMVDYGYDPVAQEKLYETVRILHPARIIHVTGSAGGGRDRARQPKLGQLAAERADIVIVTNEDPYDDDPMEIINTIADAASRAGKVDGKNLFRILDRREAIQKAVQLAQADDLVLITGKGAEQGMMVKGYRKIPWDDRSVAREVLKCGE
ncbi:MAG: UDP-N-acetylmuramoyl-L-alanyl-D-glutamate--2,6-diaminopimelate ligase [Candidatus Kerfeldbacteria bacterium]|nr:UDP-N-acetylmuramoyl-L-alanyl-D-glutamate--2,6-diaminopimelate ligase [Candidatus Kerfeldbacteria bacterium]